MRAKLLFLVLFVTSCCSAPAAWGQAAAAGRRPADAKAGAPQRSVAPEAPAPPERVAGIVDNEPWRWGALAATVVGALVLGRLLRFVLNKLAGSFERRSRLVPAVTCRAGGRAAPLAAAAVGLAAGMEFLILSPRQAAASGTATSVLVALALGYLAWCLVAVFQAWLGAYVRGRSPSKLGDMLAPLVGSTLRGAVLLLTLVQVLTILSEKPVTSILAGLGVGGIAVGLAAQDTIKNFFGSLMILGDRPFELGDRILVDAFDGTVESVGFRSTRLRTGDGDVITIPNGELASKSILNVGKRPSIRRAAMLALDHATPPDKVARAVDLVKELLAGHEGMDPQSPPRVYFGDIKDSCPVLSVTYWYHPPDFTRFNAFNERVNFEVLRRFQAEGIRLALPTQAVILAGGDKPAASS